MQPKNLLKIIQIIATSTTIFLKKESLCFFNPNFSESVRNTGWI